LDSLDQLIDRSLRNSTPEDLNYNKAILIAIATTAAIIGILTVTTIIILISLLVEKVRIKLKERREKYELIPTYHNVRQLRKLDPNFNFSCESIVPPSVRRGETYNSQRQAIISFRT